MANTSRLSSTLQEKLAQRRETNKSLSLSDTQCTANFTNDEEHPGSSTQGHSVEVKKSKRKVNEQKKPSISNNEEDAVKCSEEDKHDVIMAKSMPLPSAPVTRKEAIYENERNIELFKDLEDFTVNMEQLCSPSTTFATLMNSLLISQLSDLEKVRILFHWITKIDLNAIKFPKNLNEDTPMEFLSAINSGKKTYAQLFSRLCSAAGLHAKVISGFLKGVGYTPDYKFIGSDDPFRGTWNAVFINDQWGLIDTHWGARHVVDDEDLAIEQWTVYRYEEHYFLTNPDQFIATHFPDEPDWQLLKQPITLEHFQDSVKLWPLHFHLKLEIESPHTGVISTGLDGVAEIRLKLSDFAKEDAALRCEFRTKAKQLTVDNTSLEFCTFHYAEKDTQVFRVFCPDAGEYLLKIFAISSKYSADHFSNVAVYQINCVQLEHVETEPKDKLNVQPTEIQWPFPESHFPWGPPTTRGKVKFIPLTHTGPIVCCDENGEASVLLQALEKEEQYYLQRLYDADGRKNREKEPLTDRAMHFTTTSKRGQNIVGFRVRTPENGVFSLNLYVASKTSNNYEQFCNYLVVSRAQLQNSLPFPPIVNGVLGEDKRRCRSLDISFSAHPKYVLKGTEKYISDSGKGWMGEGESHIAFEHSQPLKVAAELIGINGSDFSNNVLVQDTGRKSLVVVRSPKQSPEVCEVGLKIYASSVQFPDGLPCVFQALVACSKSESQWLPASPKGKRWGPCLPSSCETTLVSVENTKPLFDASSSNDKSDPSPCRIFNGGASEFFSGRKYIDVTFKFGKPLVLKPALHSIDQDGSSEEQGDGTSFLVENNRSGANVRLAIPKPGNYAFILFGSPEINASQLSPLYSLLIAASTSSPNELLPRSVGLWNSSLSKLHSPTSRNLKRNAVAKIIVSLAEFVEDGSLKPFPSVLLLTDQCTGVDSQKTNLETFTYEWDYRPGPEERNLCVVIQKSLESDSVTTVLRFDVVD